MRGKNLPPYSEDNFVFLNQINKSVESDSVMRVIQWQWKEEAQGNDCCIDLQIK